MYSYDIDYSRRVVVAIESVWQIENVRLGRKRRRSYTKLLNIMQKRVNKQILTAEEGVYALIIKFAILIGPLPIFVETDFFLAKKKRKKKNT